MAVRYLPRPSSEENWLFEPRPVWPPLLSAQIVFKPTFWKYNYDDAAFWVRPSAKITALRMPVGGGFPFQPRFWRNNYDDASFWSGTPNRSIPEVDELPGGGLPFKPPYWKYNNDDPGFWVGHRSIPVFQANLLTNFITNTNILENPVDYFLMGSVWDLIDPDRKKEKPPLFTVHTNNKGYK